MSGVQVLHRRLNLMESMDGVPQWGSRWDSRTGGFSGELCLAVALHAVNLRIQIANGGTKFLLFGNADFQRIQVEGNEAPAGGGQRFGQGSQQRDALFKKFQILLRIVHSSGPLIQLVLLIALALDGRWRNRLCGHSGFHRLLGVRRILTFLFSRG
jgi:hypothetical protein